MERRLEITRNDWKEKAEECGFMYHSVEGIYWDESASYKFSLNQIEEIEKATNELHQMCIKAAEKIIQNNLFSKMHIDDFAKDLILKSWDKDDFSLFGRFDLRYDGVNPPKMYEYNADTPTGLFESSVFQWQWQEELKKSDQFNSIHEKLIEGWKKISRDTIYFTCADDSMEDLGNTLYMMDCAMQAGHNCKFIKISDIGWNGTFFTDLDEKSIINLYKLYPWEWLIDEEFGQYIEAIPLIVEPAWKMLWSNKGILPVLWKLYEGHPNLLRSYFEDDSSDKTGYTKKAIYGREGSNIEIPGIDSNGGEYTDSGYVYQETCVLPCINGRYPVIGSWTVEGESCGIGIREDTSPITKNTSRFIPHYFE